MKRTLYFYDLVLEKNNQISLLQHHPVTLAKKIKDFVDNYNDEELLYMNDSSIIQIEDITHAYIFGSYGKTTRLSEKQLTRGRAEPDMAITDLTTLEDLVESYTYFYLDIDKKECVILNNPNCTGFKSEFPKFLLLHFRLSAIYENIDIVNKLSDNIQQSIGKANHFANISYTYSSDKLPANDFLNFKEMSGIKNEQIKTAAVQLYFKAESNFKEVAKNLSSTDKYVDQFSTFKVETDSESIDVIEKMLTKKVSIPLDKDDLSDINIIKNILIENLTSY